MFWKDKLRVFADLLLLSLVLSNLWLAFLVFSARDLIYMNRAILLEIQKTLPISK